MAIAAVLQVILACLEHECTRRADDVVAAAGGSLALSSVSDEAGEVDVLTATSLAGVRELVTAFCADMLGGAWPEGKVKHQG
ncbi:hypothetical protein BaRGS_00027465 [Batillaria attramentaria]|uniref:Uncharacterized protein n=1 Tax=Batillaria attramentaria TaxID=370345 RepID=A0ABD0K1C5_9CAEN